MLILLALLFTYPLPFPPPTSLFFSSFPHPVSSFSQQIFNLTLFLCQVSCQVLGGTVPRCGEGRGPGQPCHLALWLVPSLCPWPCLPEIPGVGAFWGRALPFVFVKGSKLCDGISSAVFSCYPRARKNKTGLHMKNGGRLFASWRGACKLFAEGQVEGDKLRLSTWSHLPSLWWFQPATPPVMASSVQGLPGLP